MDTWRKTILIAGGVSLMAGCATRELPPDEMPPTAAGTDFVTDNSDAAFYVEGPWIESDATDGFVGDNYHVIQSGQGDNYAVWNIETIREYEIFARWTAHSNRASDAKYTIDHINDDGDLVTETVTVNQRQNGAEWVSLGTYRMSNLTGRVTLSDNADGYVVADAIRFVPTLLSVKDSDGDGMPDDYEMRYGLDPNDPSDASNDPDGDGLTNVDEFISGLDPTMTDAPEYVEPDEPGFVVTLSWTPPTTRENGEPLSSDDIAYYEVEYSPVTDSASVQVDDESDFFRVYGGDVQPSSHTSGYVGSGYYPLPPGGGEILAEWAIYELVPGTTYRLEANWTSAKNRSSSAPYTINYVDDTGSVLEHTVKVDQTKGGGAWWSLAEFTPGDTSIIIELTNVQDGYSIADAVRVVPISSGEVETLIVDEPSKTSVSVSGLESGVWQFRVRAVDVNGVKSRYTGAVTHQVYR